MQLSGKQRRFLRALAHPLKPVVQVGIAGVTPAVVAQLREALTTHELVKIKVSSESPEDVTTTSVTLAAAAQSAVAQVIGRTIVLYRAREKNPTIELPG